MPSLRCSDCFVQWPPSWATYQRCPECGGGTWQCSDDSIPEAEAKSRKAHADFARYLKDTGRV